MARKRSSLDEPKLQVTLTETGIKLRLFFMVLALAVAAYAFYHIFTQVLHTQPGWNTVTVDRPQTTAADEFRFEYYFGISDTSASAEWVALHKRYSGLLDSTYRTFMKEEVNGVANLYTIGTHPNEPVAVEPALYAALKQLEEAGSRYIYYGPVYEVYRGLAGCEDDWQAEYFDPEADADLAAYVKQVCAYAADPDSISLDILEDNKVRLNISEAYLAFAADNEIEYLLDFYYWQNAFVLDHVADTLIEEGYTAGILTTTEGFARALGHDKYSMTVIGTGENVSYDGPMSILSLHNAPVVKGAWFHTASDGIVSGPFIDAETGLSLHEVRYMTAMSEQIGCTELLLKLWDGFIADDIDAAALKADGIELH